MASPSIVYREGAPMDQEQIAALGRRVFTATYGHAFPPKDLESYLEVTYTPSAVLGDIHARSNTWVVAESSEGNILGFALIKRETSEPCTEHLKKAIELNRLYVDQNFHGNGIGKSLAKYAEEQARKWGFKNIWLGVWENAQAARAVYKRLGYEQIGSHDFAVGNTIHHDLILSKAL